MSNKELGFDSKTVELLQRIKDKNKAYLHNNIKINKMNHSDEINSNDEQIGFN
jgi:hypothetical protein